MYILATVEFILKTVKNNFSSIYFFILYFCIHFIFSVCSVGEKVKEG